MKRFKEPDMLKKTILFVAAVFSLSGCTREVYLQAVPCEEDNCKPCASYTQSCPELEMQTVTVQYSVYDVPAPKTVYTPCSANRTRNCRTVCRQVQVN